MLHPLWVYRHQNWCQIWFYQRLWNSINQLVPMLSRFVECLDLAALYSFQDEQLWRPLLCIVLDTFHSAMLVAGQRLGSRPARLRIVVANQVGRRGLEQLQSAPQPIQSTLPSHDLHCLCGWFPRERRSASAQPFADVFMTRPCWARSILHRAREILHPLVVPKPMHFALLHYLL